MFALRSCTLLVLLALHASSLSLERVRLVDYSNSSSAAAKFLFRGDVPDWTSDNTHFKPDGNASFRYDMLLGFFTTRINEKGWEMPPPPYFIIDVNLLSNDSQQERNAIGAEMAFFSSKPSLGVFVSWPIVGTPFNAMSFNESQREEMLRDNFTQILDRNDRLAQLLPFLHSALHNNSFPAPRNSTVFVYVHCIGGIDRTGEVMGSYVMKYQG